VVNITSHRRLSRGGAIIIINFTLHHQVVKTGALFSLGSLMLFLCFVSKIFSYVLTYAASGTASRNCTEINCPLDARLSSAVISTSALFDTPLHRGVGGPVGGGHYGASIALDMDYISPSRRQGHHRGYAAVADFGPHGGIPPAASIWSTDEITCKHLQGGWPRNNSFSGGELSSVGGLMNNRGDISDHFVDRSSLSSERHSRGTGALTLEVQSRGTNSSMLGAQSRGNGASMRDRQSRFISHVGSASFEAPISFPGDGSSHLLVPEQSSLLFLPPGGFLMSTPGGSVDDRIILPAGLDSLSLGYPFPTNFPLGTFPPTASCPIGASNVDLLDPLGLRRGSLDLQPSALYLDPETGYVYASTALIDRTGLAMDESVEDRRKNMERIEESPMAGVCMQSPVASH